MEQETNQSSSRRKFIFFGLGAAVFFSVSKFLKTSKKKKTVKMLTQDGKLVEVSEDILPSKRKKITSSELQNWVKQRK